VSHVPAAATPAVVVGAGLAGLATALRLAPEPCVVVTTGHLGQAAATAWAQGGLAAALGPDDSPEQHATDTLAAGAGLCDAEVVRQVTAGAGQAVAFLEGVGARFDRGAGGGYRLGLEAAHSRRRILHAGGDGSGAEILCAVVERIRRAPSVTVLEHTSAVRLTTSGEGVTGIVVSRAGHGEHHIAASRVVLATGGTGALWRHTTNPLTAVGQGLALAARAGAVLRDLEMVQFHPTALDVGTDPMPLVSEAVRGAGATFADQGGQPLPIDPLGPRDVVARAVWAHQATGRRVHLDARRSLGRDFATAFPGVAAACRAAGIDPAVDLVPVRPAAHYHCGGVAVDERGRTSVPGLWACGEVSSTGLHGANRLASNSLLEAVVSAGSVAEDVASSPRRPARHAPASGAVVPPVVSPATLARTRRLLSEAAGVLRDGPILERAVADLSAHAVEDGLEAIDDATLVAWMVCASALRRTESRGGHTRTDHPEPAAQPAHTLLTLPDLAEDLPAPTIARSA
jgi:L-aspartate oxidase